VWLIVPRRGAAGGPGERSTRTSSALWPIRRPGDRDSAEIASELRRGADYVPVTLALTILATDVADALAIGWNAIRSAACDDLAGWEVTSAAAEVQPEPPLASASCHTQPYSRPPSAGRAGTRAEGAGDQPGGAAHPRRESVAVAPLGDPGAAKQRGHVELTPKAGSVPPDQGSMLPRR